MPAQELIPPPHTIPVHWGWLYFLLILTFYLHILFMNAMLGTGIIALFYEFKPGNKDKNSQLSREISKKLIFFVAFAVNLGVAALLFLQVLYGQFLYVSSVLMAVYWLLIVILLILAYYGTYIYNMRYNYLPLTRKFLILGIVLLFLSVAFFFSNNMTLMLEPQHWRGYFQNPGGTLLNLQDPSLVPRYLHFVTASVAVGGLVIAISGRWKKGNSLSYFQNSLDTGMRWFTAATFIQIILGFLFLISLPQKVILGFLGGNTLYTAVFIFTLTCSFLLLVLGTLKKLWSSVATLLLTLVGMVLMRDFVRSMFLEDYYNLQDLKPSPQYSSFVLFLSALILGVALIIYLCRKSLQTSGKES
ncbi:MAG: hypothetical protein ACOCZ2_01745 [Thermodesulfobacteriota bacterium]